MDVRVTLIEGAAHLLPREAPALGETLASALTAEGIDVRLGAFASRVDRDGETTSCGSTTALSCAAIACSWPPAADRGSMAWASRRS
jgi:NADH dehydrogenase FAD-containing subunit